MDCNRNVESHDKQLFIFLNCVISIFSITSKSLYHLKTDNILKVRILRSHYFVALLNLNKFIKHNIVLVVILS